MEKEVIIIKIRGYEAGEVMAIVGDLRRRQKETVTLKEDVQTAEATDDFVEMEDGASKAQGIGVDMRKVGETEWERIKTVGEAAEKAGISGSTLSHKLRLAKGRLRYKGFEFIYAALNDQKTGISC